MYISFEGTTAEVAVILDFLRHQPSILNVDKIYSEAIAKMKSSIPENDELLKNIFDTKKSDK